MLPDRRWRFEFAVRERESKSKITQPASLEQLMREQGLRPEDFLVENSMVYSYEAKIASHWRKDKIFLLGDAAHYQPGITGSGLCHSMRDAINLCWKLAYVIKGKASPSLLETYEEERHQITRESLAKSIEKSKEDKSISARTLCRKAFWWMMRLTMGDIWTMRARHRRQPNSGLPYVSGGFTIPSLDDKATTAGKMMISPKLRVIYAEPWAHSLIQNTSMQITRKGGSSKNELAFLDAFVSWRDITIIWMTRSALDPSAHSCLSEQDQKTLAELDATVLHVRLVTDVSNSKAKGADATLKDDVGRFTEWATTAFNEKKEVLVLRPDLVIFGVYTHKDASNIVPDLEDMLWFTGS